MDWQGAIGVAVGILGVTISFWTAFGGWRTRRPRLEVALAYGTTGMGEVASFSVWIRVVNWGAIDIELQTVGLMTPDEHRLTCEPSGGSLQPRNILLARTSATFSIAPREVFETLMMAQCVGTVALRAYCVDALGYEYRSSPVPFEVRPHLSGQTAASGFVPRATNS